MVYGVTEFVVNATPVVSNEVIKEAGWRTMYGGDHRTTSGVNVNESSALGYAPFWRAVNLISGDVAGMPCDIYKRQRDGGKKYADTHPAAPLLRDMASPWWRADECRRVLTSHAADSWQRICSDHQRHDGQSDCFRADRSEWRDDQNHGRWPEVVHLV